MNILYQEDGKFELNLSQSKTSIHTLWTDSHFTWAAQHESLVMLGGRVTILSPSFRCGLFGKGLCSKALPH